MLSQHQLETKVISHLKNLGYPSVKQINGQLMDIVCSRFPEIVFVQIGFDIERSNKLIKFSRNVGSIPVRATNPDHHIKLIDLRNHKTFVPGCTLQPYKTGLA